MSSFELNLLLPWCLGCFPHSPRWARNVGKPSSIGICSNNSLVLSEQEVNNSILSLRTGHRRVSRVSGVSCRRRKLSRCGLMMRSGGRGGSSRDPGGWRGPVAMEVVAVLSPQARSQVLNWAFQSQASTWK